jgi:hypothetical protein
LARPVILGPVEGRRAEPILQGEFMAVANTQTALLRAIDEEQAPERPEGLPAQIGAVLLVEDQHPRAALHQFAGGHQARQTCTDNDHVSGEPGSRRIGHVATG